MVREANMKQAASEKQLKEAWGKVRPVPSSPGPAESPALPHWVTWWVPPAWLCWGTRPALPALACTAQMDPCVALGSKDRQPKDRGPEPPSVSAKMSRASWDWVELWTLTFSVFPAVLQSIQTPGSLPHLVAACNTWLGPFCLPRAWDSQMLPAQSCSQWNPERALSPL